MKKVITAFFMAWGNFLTIPCPYKRWDNSLKKMMLAFYPSVGAVAGFLWALLAYALLRFHIPYLISSVVLIIFIFSVCGFMHLDGFLDCNDAILSRRPLEDKLRILKDSTVGAFAVVTCIFLMLLWFATMISLYMGLYRTILFLGVLFVIPVSSRVASALWVMIYPPLSTSQYAENKEEEGQDKYLALILAQLVIYDTIGYFVTTSFTVIAVSSITILASYLGCFYARRQLGGVSGDIAGYSLCIGEISGLVGFALLIGGLV